MKKLVLFLASALFLLPAIGFCQQHLTFKNVPIDGSLSSFIDTMKKEGFTVDKQTEKNALIKGTFAGEECEIYSRITKNKNGVENCCFLSKGNGMVFHQIGLQ